MAEPDDEGSATLPGKGLMRREIYERVASIGGGTGSFTMLSELKKVVSNLSAIVTMMDSGGSSRRLIDEFGRPLPLGDLRQALVALSRSRKLWGDIFSYRFPDSDSGSIGGHSLGNLILHALLDLNTDDLIGALDDAEEILNTAGHVIPVTMDEAMLCAELADGTIIEGESAIDRPDGRSVLPIKRVFLEPGACATPRARKALERADKVLIGPGDLYTSIIPCLLVDGMYICNVMTKHGETDDFAASDFVREIHKYLGRRVDSVIVNTGSFPPELLERYAAEKAFPVEPDVDVLRTLVPRLLAGPVATTERLIRHDAERVILTIWPDLVA
jgi:uncharacterized cofD-like protein